MNLHKSLIMKFGPGTVTLLNDNQTVTHILNVMFRFILLTL